MKRLNLPMNPCFKVIHELTNSLGSYHHYWPTNSYSSYDLHTVNVALNHISKDNWMMNIEITSQLRKSALGKYLMIEFFNVELPRDRVLKELHLVFRKNQKSRNSLLENSRVRGWDFIELTIIAEEHWKRATTALGVESLFFACPES